MDDSPPTIEERMKRIRKSEIDAQVSKELERLREQNQKQWEYTNGGKLPNYDDPNALDPYEHEMFRDLGIRDSQNESNTDETLGFVVLLTVIIIALVVFT